MARVAPSVARSMPSSMLFESTGAISRRPSTSPACRAPIDAVAAWTGGAPSGTAAGANTSPTMSNPAPHKASATAAMAGLAPGR